VIVMGKVIGSLLGTAVGDAIGLPYEGLSRRRALKLLGKPTRHRLFFGKGMVSDDTEHTCMVAQALVESGGDPEKFERSLAWRMRIWLLGMPAGIGFATLRAIVKLWCGVPPLRSGVFSAGNGPAMRAAILGTVAEGDRLRELVRRSARMTHSDPKAEAGSFAVAFATLLVCKTPDLSGEQYLEALQLELDEPELLGLLRQVVDSVAAGEGTIAFADRMFGAWGVSGYVYQTVPVAIHAWLSYPQDFRGAIEVTVACGGDTDSVAAIVGGIVGAAVGVEGIPAAWRSELIEWPRSLDWMERLGRQLEDGMVGRAIELSFLSLLLRNVGFLAIVIFHGFRRLLPF
jgi:ADP-ribosyl-[dinitrogen reductase] hydrolase